MESTDVEGRIQVPHDVYERLRHAFLLEERGEVQIKGKGVMRTWYLTGRKTAVHIADDDVVAQLSAEGEPVRSRGR